MTSGRDPSSYTLTRTSVVPHASSETTRQKVNWLCPRWRRWLRVHPRCVSRKLCFDLLKCHRWGTPLLQPIWSLPLPRFQTSNSCYLVDGKETASVEELSCLAIALICTIWGAQIYDNLSLELDETGSVKQAFSAKSVNQQEHVAVDEVYLRKALLTEFGWGVTPAFLQSVTERQRHWNLR